MQMVNVETHEHGRNSLIAAKQPFTSGKIAGIKFIFPNR